MITIGCSPLTTHTPHLSKAHHHHHNAQDEAADVSGQSWTFPPVWGMPQANNTLAGVSSSSSPSTLSSPIIIVIIIMNIDTQMITTTSWWPKRTWRSQPHSQFNKKTVKCKFRSKSSAHHLITSLALTALPPSPTKSIDSKMTSRRWSWIRSHTSLSTGSQTMILFFCFQILLFPGSRMPASQSARWKNNDQGVNLSTAARKFNATLLSIYTGWCFSLVPP